MPSMYSHYYFGQLVYQKLPNHLQKDIQPYLSYYHVGQNGPDVLLYHAPLKGSLVARQNQKIHMNSGLLFFEKANFIHQNRKPHLAYLYGYLCHFVLDAYCHPYIENYKKETGISHMAIEREFERYLLEKNGLNPFKYDLTQHIHLNSSLEEVMASYVDGANQKDLSKTLIQLKIMYAFTRPSSYFKRSLVYLWMDSIKRPYLKDFVFQKEPLKECHKSNQDLEQLLNEAILKAVKIIEDFQKGILNDPIFNEIFG